VTPARPVTKLGAGQAASLVRRLAGPVDAFALHAALAGDGHGTPPLFIQRTGGPASRRTRLAACPAPSFVTGRSL
jgi:hypothetical protein